MLVEDEIEALLVAAYSTAFGKQPTPEWLKAIGMRAGAFGEIATLDQAAEATGVSRQRVQQVWKKLQPLFKGKVLVSLSAIAKELAQNSPVAEPIGRLLGDKNLARPTLTGKAFFNFLAMVGATTSDLIGTDLVFVNGWVVLKSEVPVTQALALAKKHTSTYGMTTVEEIRQALATPQAALDATDIQRVLANEPSVKWQGGWLWVAKDADNLFANRLVNIARSILSVNSPQTVASIHEGARRVWKFRGLDILAPIDAMRGFFEVSPYFVVEGETVAPVVPLDYHDVLGGVTATMIDVLKSSPHQVMDRQSLDEACKDAGIASGTYGIWTTYAEWMERFALNVWGLRGSNPNPAAVEIIRLAAKARSKAEPRKKTWSWAADGKVLQTMDATTSMLGNGVLSFDQEVHKLLAGKMLTVLHNGQHVASPKFGADHPFSWRWHPAFTALNLKQGDVFQIRIDVTSSSAEIVGGGQELWD